MKQYLPLLLVVASGACARIHSTETVTEIQRYTSVEVDPKRTTGVVAANCTFDTTEMRCQFSQDYTCSENTVEYSQQQRTVEKKASTAVQVLEYVGGLALVGAGVAVVIDAPNVPTEDDPDAQNPISQKGAYGIGIGTIVAGGVLLTMGVINSVRAADTREIMPVESKQIGAREVSCGNSVLQNSTFSIRQDGTAPPVSFFGEEAYNEYSNPHILKIRSQEVYSGASDNSGQAHVLISDFQTRFCPDGGSRRYTLYVGGTSVDMTAQFATLCTESNVERNRLIALANAESSKQLAASTIQDCQSPVGADQFEKCYANFKKALSNLPSSDHPEITAAYETFMVSYNTFKAEQGQRQAAEHLKSGKEFYRQKEWNQAKLEAENCLERSPGLKECAKLLTSSQIALDREWAREQAAEERAARLAERTVSIDWSESAFEDFWFAVSGNYYVSDDEFENKKRERSALKNQREALKKTYSFTVPEVDVSDFDFRRKRFVISLPGLMGTPYRGENYISFQRVNSVSGDYYFSAMWVMQNASRLRRPSAEIKFSSEEDARDWRDSNTSIVAEVSNCRIGTEWEIGGYATKISGVYLKGCVVTFKNEITDEILAEVRM